MGKALSFRWKIILNSLLFIINVKLGFLGKGKLVVNIIWLILIIILIGYVSAIKSIAIGSLSKEMGYTIITGCILLIVGVNYLPTYRHPATILSDIYPLNKLERTFMNLMLDVTTKFNLSMLVLFSTYCLVSQTHCIYVVGILSLGIVILSEWSLRLAFDSDGKQRIKLITGNFFAIGLVVMFLFFFSKAIISDRLQILLLIALLLPVGYCNLKYAPNVSEISNNNTNISDGSSVRLNSINQGIALVFYRTRHIRILFVLVVSLHLLTIIPFIFDGILNQSRVAILTVFTSGLYSFAYIFCNSFGLLSYMWLTLQTEKNNSSKLYSNITIPVLLIISLFQFFFFSLLNVLTWKMFLCIFSISVILFAIGYVSSTYFPINIRRMPNFLAQERSATHSGGLLAFAIILGLSYSQFLLSDITNTLIQILCIIASITVIYALQHNERYYKQLTFKKMYL
jgi:hypothetical protein